MEEGKRALLESWIEEGRIEFREREEEVRQLQRELRYKVEIMEGLVAVIKVYIDTIAEEVA